MKPAVKFVDEGVKVSRTRASVAHVDLLRCRTYTVRTTAVLSNMLHSLGALAAAGKRNADGIFIGPVRAIIRCKPER